MTNITDQVVAFGLFENKTVRQHVWITGRVLETEITCYLFLQ